MKIDYAAAPHPAFELRQEALSEAVIAQNNMSPCDGVIMTKTGELRPGYLDEPELLCMLIPAGQLARRLTADALSSYTGKELRKWADALDRAPLQKLVDAAVQAYLDSLREPSELLGLLRLFPGVEEASLDAQGKVQLKMADGAPVPEAAAAWLAALN
ncbi:MAG TPA: hypothetical protein H9862_03455 [Candidatus Akkermansia intestinigallinarum]|uniref:Uncharacterized protein n=1 Tax=Candidatus Akkermansia intestinigallinarum TaxID=2838431 RepID=A0A9D2AH06_9BACT|nr:hypothetical protein [Candidatus Akkermansia intestinigallinarum]